MRSGLPFRQSSRSIARLISAFENSNEDLLFGWRDIKHVAISELCNFSDALASPTMAIGPLFDTNFNPGCS